MVCLLLLYYADDNVHKIDLKNFKELLVREVGRRNIKVMLNTEASPEFIKTFNPDAVILAVGASPCVSPIPGIKQAMNVLQVYGKGSQIGKKVIIVGGGLLPVVRPDCTWRIRATRLLSSKCRIGWRGAWSLELTATVRQIERRQNIKVKTGWRCTEISAGSVKVKNAAGAQEKIQGDTVVYSLGMKARPS